MAEHTSRPSKFPTRLHRTTYSNPWPCDHGRAGRSVDPLDENVWTNPLRSSRRTLWLNISLKGTNFELLIRILDIRYLISFVAINFFFFVILILTIVLYNNSFISMLFNIINANTKYDKN